MKFKIDLGEPKVKKEVNCEASDLAEAMQLCFPLDIEDAVLTLGEIPIPISYKYDLSVILEDILIILRGCLTNENTKIRFGSDTFNSDWNIRPVSHEIIFSTYWYSTVGNREVDLNKIGSIVVSKEYFVAQWLNLIKVGLDGVKQTGITIEDTEMLHEVEELLGRLSA